MSSTRIYRAGEDLYPRIGDALGVPVHETDDSARTIIIGELTKRVASDRPR